MICPTYSSAVDEGGGVIIAFTHWVPTRNSLKVNSDVNDEPFAAKLCTERFITKAGHRLDTVFDRVWIRCLNQSFIQCQDRPFTGWSPSERLWECLFPHWNRKFWQNGTLKSHAKMHLEERRFLCTAGSKGFAR